MQQTITASLAPAHPVPPIGLGRARLLLWSAFFFLFLAIEGLGWGRAWQATHTFENFYSPPHIFIYSTLAVSAFIIAIIVFSPRIRPLFGPGFRFPLFPFEVPGALFLLGGGFVILAIAGILMAEGNFELALEG